MVWYHTASSNYVRPIARMRERHEVLGPEQPCTHFYVEMYQHKKLLVVVRGGKTTVWCELLTLLNQHMMVRLHHYYFSSLPKVRAKKKW